MTNRQFSLRRLLIGVSAVGMLCGLAVRFPEESLAFGLLVGLFLPTVVVCQVLVSLSRQRMLVLAVSLLGAALAGLIAMPAYMAGPPATIWSVVQGMLFPLAIVAPLGALLLGGAVVLDEVWSKPRAR